MKRSSYPSNWTWHQRSSRGSMSFSRSSTTRSRSGTGIWRSTSSEATSSGSGAGDRAGRITEYWMRRVAGEEGRFDIDIVQTGISQSQRDQIITLRDVISQLSEQSPAGSADYEEIVRVAGERGIPQVKVDQWLKRWAQEGDVYTRSEEH